MGSASRSALDAAVEALGSAKAVTRETGEQLLTAAREIAGSPQLRAVLVDPSIPADQKAKLIKTVFGSLSATAAGLLGEMVAARWSNADQLVDGVENIGIRAIAQSAGDEQIEGRLFEFARAVASDHDLELAVGSTLSDPEQKAALVQRLLNDSDSPGAVAILTHLVRSPRGRRIGELIQSAAQTVAAATGGFVAIVTAAAPLAADQERKLSETLAAQYGAQPRIDLRIDPGVIGGLRVQVGDEVVDGTVASRIAELRLQLA